MLRRLLLAGLLAAGIASPQRGGGGRNGGGGEMGGDSSPIIVRPPESKLDRISSRLKLNKEQKAEVESILNAAQEEAKPVVDKLFKARMSITNAMIAGKCQAEIDRELSAYTAVSAEMTGVESKAFSRIFAMLKANQQSKAAPALEEMAGMFLGRDWRRVR
jgi:hypothetical protein